MKTRLFIAAVLIVTFSVTSFGIGIPATAKSKTFNRNLIIKNLINGVNSDNEGLRLSSVYYLGEWKSDEAIIPLLKILKSDENEDARILAALSLYKIGDGRGIFAIKQAITFDESAVVRRTCSLFYNAYLKTKQE
jgi:hypothetical protein